MVAISYSYRQEVLFGDKNVSERSWWFFQFFTRNTRRLGADRLFEFSRALNGRFDDALEKKEMSSRLAL